MADRMEYSWDRIDEIDQTDNGIKKLDNALEDMAKDGWRVTTAFIGPKNKLYVLYERKHTPKPGTAYAAAV